MRPARAGQPADSAAASVSSAPASTVTGSPHEGQNFASAASRVAQPLHAFASVHDGRADLLTSCPHEPQAANPGATAAPQDGQ